MNSASPVPSFTAIKDAVSIDAALAPYPVTLVRSGARLTTACPIHGGHNRRAFVISPDRRTWYCFGDCARGGSVLDLIMALERCSLAEAAEILITRHGVRHA